MSRLEAIFASRNPHKLEQVAVLLDDVDLIPLDDVAPDLELKEELDTFEGNALAKAIAVTDVTGRVAIADDSGLEVDVLGGAPGVHSARFAGEDASDRDNNALLVAKLKELTPPFPCRYRCVAIATFPGGRAISAEGSCEGTVVLESRGDLGFGYDPHVVPEGDTRTMGEIPLEEKLKFSHRGRAFRELARRLNETI